MRLNNIQQVEEFLDAVKLAKGDVWLESQQGDRYNLKSVLVRYIAIGALIEDHKNDLELFCANKSDEAIFLHFFEENPTAL